MNEIWKDINGYEGHYQVSSLGGVRSIKYKKYDKYTALHQRINLGYKYVSLCKNGIIKSFSVHGLVASAFVGNPHKHKQINHIDENKQNNSVGNLEWCDAKHNSNYGGRNEKISRKREIAILKVDAKTNIIIGEYESGRKAAKILGLNETSIYKCCNNKQSMYAGFVWVKKINYCDK